MTRLDPAMLAALNELLGAPAPTGGGGMPGWPTPIGAGGPMPPLIESQLAGGPLPWQRNMYLGKYAPSVWNNLDAAAARINPLAQLAKVSAVQPGAGARSPLGLPFPTPDLTRPVGPPVQGPPAPPAVPLPPPTQPMTPEIMARGVLGRPSGPLGVPPPGSMGLGATFPGWGGEARVPSVLDSPELFAQKGFKPGTLPGLEEFLGKAKPSAPAASGAIPVPDEVAAITGGKPTGVPPPTTPNEPAIPAGQGTPSAASPRAPSSWRGIIGQGIMNTIRGGGGGLLGGMAVDTPVRFLESAGAPKEASEGLRGAGIGAGTMLGLGNALKTSLARGGLFGAAGGGLGELAGGIADRANADPRLSSALRGAGMGAGIGMTVGPIGAAVGAGIGWILGALTGKHPEEAAGETSGGSEQRRQPSLEDVMQQRRVMHSMMPQPREPDFIPFQQFRPSQPFQQFQSPDTEEFNPDTFEARYPLLRIPRGGR